MPRERTFVAATRTRALRTRPSLPRVDAADRPPPCLPLPTADDTFARNRGVQIVSCWAAPLLTPHADATTRHCPHSQSSLCRLDTHSLFLLVHHLVLVRCVQLCLLLSRLRLGMRYVSPVCHAGGLSRHGSMLYLVWTLWRWCAGHMRLRTLHSRRCFRWSRPGATFVDMARLPRALIKISYL